MVSMPFLNAGALKKGIFAAGFLPALGFTVAPAPLLAADEALSEEQQAIAALAFLTGRWAGEGLSFAPDGARSSYFDTEYVRFDLDRKLLLINARGTQGEKEYYSLHTVIYYDADADMYKYTAYRGTGAPPNTYSCTLIDQQFICMNAREDFRLTFQRLKTGEWNEFGEIKAESGWRKSFETILSAADE